MEVPASISGDDQAALAIQRSYRKFQKRVMEDHEDLAEVRVGEKNIKNIKNTYRKTNKAPTSFTCL